MMKTKEITTRVQEQCIPLLTTGFQLLKSIFRAGGVAQVAEQTRKCESLSPNPSTTNNNNK
jgi:hypothetical protein